MTTDETQKEGKKIIMTINETLGVKDEVIVRILKEDEKLDEEIKELEDRRKAKRAYIQARIDAVLVK